MASTKSPICASNVQSRWESLGQPVGDCTGKTVHQPHAKHEADAPNAAQNCRDSNPHRIEGKEFHLSPQSTPYTKHATIRPSQTPKGSRLLDASELIQNFTKSGATKRAHKFHVITNHSSAGKLREAVKIGVVPSFKIPSGADSETTCLACAGSKTTPAHHYRTTHQHPTGSVLNFDICGPLPTPNRYGKSYFLTVTDVGSRCETQSCYAGRPEQISKFAALSNTSRRQLLTPQYLLGPTTSGRF